MDPNRIHNLSVTPTVARQTPRNEFGEVLKNTLKGAANIGGALIGALPGGAIVSAAVTSVTSFASQGNQAVGRSASAAVGTVGGGSGTIGTVSGSGGASNPLSGSVPTEFNDMLSTMRSEADKSIAMQMQMQQESREYNTLTNVLKVRHDSAKAAINNIR